MKLDKIKEKLEQLNSKNAPKVEKKNYFWKPPVGKETIRVVPSKFNKDTPFSEVYFHYGIGKKTIMSPINWGEKDPIKEFSDQLKKTKVKEDWILSKTLEPKMRIFIPIVVRGKEEEGVKLWSFGKTMYMDFLNLADNEDIGDFTDILTGKDIIVTTIGKEQTGTDYAKSTIMPKFKESPLTTDKKLLKQLLEDQVDPLDTYDKLSAEEIKSILQDHLAPSTESDDVEEEDEELPITKTSKAKEFAQLFDK